jgi:hypothetical protein
MMKFLALFYWPRVLPGAMRPIHIILYACHSTVDTTGYFSPKHPSHDDFWSTLCTVLYAYCLTLHRRLPHLDCLTLHRLHHLDCSVSPSRTKKLLRITQPSHNHKQNLTMTTADEIQSLLESGAYSADSIPQLEQYVDAQVSGSAPYHFGANRTLAKLYQFFPDKSNAAMVGRILMLAVLQFPKTDILALLCLVPEKTQEIEPVATVIR